MIAPIARTSLTICFIFSIITTAQNAVFNTQKDLLLAQFDCKTDVDDLHTVAAFATLVQNEDYAKLNYHAIAGTYGIQEGLYVPANELFVMAFNDRWSDAHNNKDEALNEVLKKVLAVLDDGGTIWVAEAGQSDFSAQWIAALAKLKPTIDFKKRIHVVQHSNWNEEVTDQKLLDYVKSKVNYHKIPDGNAVGNGTPGFRSETKIAWKNYLKDDPNLLAIWEKALAIGNQYNGKDGRYLNEAIAKGGLDFSDLSETCYILGLQNLVDADNFFKILQ